MLKKRLGAAKERFWNRLRGHHNHRVRTQLDHMVKTSTITAQEHRYLVDRSYAATEAEIWRLIIDHIRISAMQDFDQGVYKPPRKRHKRAYKKR